LPTSRNQDTYSRSTLLPRTSREAEKRATPSGEHHCTCRLREKVLWGMYSFLPSPSFVSHFLSQQALCQPRLATVTGERSSYEARGQGLRKTFLSFVFFLTQRM